jgi:hypothetical protein
MRGFSIITITMAEKEHFYALCKAMIIFSSNGGILLNF